MHGNEHYKTTIEITYETTNEIWYLQILVIKVTCLGWLQQIERKRVKNQIPNLNTKHRTQYSLYSTSVYCIKLKPLDFSLFLL